MGDLQQLRNRLQKVIDNKSIGSHPTMLDTEIVTALYRAEKCIEDMAKYIAGLNDDEDNWQEYVPLQHHALIKRII
jgi:hypothetical protein